jgi:hypothetical protein
MDNTDATLIRLTAVITKQIDANWAEGSDMGGFPSGLTLTADTWYHYFVIAKTDGTVDSGWDTSLTATNLLADATGFTLFRRIASHLTDSSSNIFGFDQQGDTFNYDLGVEDASVSNPGTSAVIVTLTTPIGIVTEGILFVRLSDVSPAGTTSFYVSPISATDVAPATSAKATFLVSTASEFATGQIMILTDTSSQIRFRLSVSSADHTVQVSTFGYVDKRGKE